MPQTDLLDADKIKANLRTKRIGRKVLVYSSTASTNSVAAEYAKNKLNDGLVVFAEHQTAGRGRSGAKWHSRFAESILCSILLTDSNYPSELLCLTCAVATAEAIGQVAGSTAGIKWPNDIILNGSKVAGILIESRTGRDKPAQIIGVGINCHQKKDSFDAELQQRATSIDIETQTTCDRISLARRLLTSFDHWLGLVETHSDKITDRWQKLSIRLNQRVTLIYNGDKFTGYCIGIDPRKGLIVQLDTGGVRMFDAAHTSILPQGRGGSAHHKKNTTYTDLD